MSKQFYSIDYNTYDSYSIAHLLSNNFAFPIYLESRFGFYAGFHDRMLISIDESYSNEFESIAHKINLIFKKEDLNKQYNSWINKKIYEKEILNDDFLQEQKIFKIKEFEIKHVNKLKDGSQLLTEEEVTREDKILIYVNSNELTHHHIPHVHIDYEGERNYCVISLIDFKVLAPKGFWSSEVSEFIELLKTVINDARKTWNEKTNGLLIFVKENSGMFSNRTCKRT